MKKNGTKPYTVKWSGPYPTCDICEEAEARYDGQTVYKKWAYMCQNCYIEVGVGLGLGLGQELVK